MLYPISMGFNFLNKFILYYSFDGVSFEVLSYDSRVIALYDTLYFIFRYIPFWSIPLGMIFAQFGYVYWVKDVKHVAKSFFFCGFICALFLIYYIYAGSPERSAQILDGFFRSI